MIPNLISDHTIENRPDVERAVRDQIESCPPATIAWIQRAMAVRPDSFGVLEEVGVPVLVIVGTEDLLSPPSEALAMAEAAQRATLIEIPQVGHLTPLENPEVVGEAMVNWLSELFVEADGE
jgi:pimeloyl-ACP methyl ester carboxylesterase